MTVLFVEINDNPNKGEIDFELLILDRERWVKQVDVDVRGTRRVRWILRGRVNFNAVHIHPCYQLSYAIIAIQRQIYISTSLVSVNPHQSTHCTIRCLRDKRKESDP